MYDLEHSPDPQGTGNVAISLRLPELKKGQRLIQEAQEFSSLTAEECRKKQQEFYELDVFKDSKGEDVIITDEVQVSIKSYYVPTIKLLDIPGIPSTLSRNKMNKTCISILKKYLGGTTFKQVHVLACFKAKCDTQGKDFIEAIKNIPMSKNTILDTVLIATRIDEVTWLRSVTYVNFVCSPLTKLLCVVRSHATKERRSRVGD